MIDTTPDPNEHESRDQGKHQEDDMVKVGVVKQLHSDEEQEQQQQQRQRQQLGRRSGGRPTSTTSSSTSTTTTTTTSLRSTTTTSTVVSAPASRPPSPAPGHDGHTPTKLDELRAPSPASPATKAYFSKSPDLRRRVAPRRSMSYITTIRSRSPSSKIQSSATAAASKSKSKRRERSPERGRTRERGRRRIITTLPRGRQRVVVTDMWGNIIYVYTRKIKEEGTKNGRAGGRKSSSKDSSANAPVNAGGKGLRRTKGTVSRDVSYDRPPSLKPIPEVKVTETSPYSTDRSHSLRRSGNRRVYRTPIEPEPPPKPPPERPKTPRTPRSRTSGGRAAHHVAPRHPRSPPLRPPLGRSNAQTRSPARRPAAHRARVSPPQSVRQAAPASVAQSKQTSSRRAGLLDALRRAQALKQQAVRQQKPPERLIECLTCGEEDIPISKSAKLGCGHRMCHDCLRRIFALSVTDPQHMPPKCCTNEHIPLKLVEHLFNTKFKVLWNKKYQEYSTKNRIYCPMRGCGEWIRPTDMRIDKSTNRKYGKCQRCRTKICVLCNRKWHTRRECRSTSSDSTKRFEETAKQAGWQRCFNCKAWVELKEGCNHMTCRCTAEFCMICGQRWKTCDCPWFNYTGLDIDALPGGFADPHDYLIHEPGGAPPLYNLYRAQHHAAQHAQQQQRRGHHARDPRQTYADELARRRAQERADEALARRMQVFGVDDEDRYDARAPAAGYPNADFANAARPFLNDDYVRNAADFITQTYGQARVAAAAAAALGSDARVRERSAGLAHRGAAAAAAAAHHHGQAPGYGAADAAQRARSRASAGSGSRSRRRIERERAERAEQAAAALRQRERTRERVSGNRERERERERRYRGDVGAMAGLARDGSRTGASRVERWRAHVENDPRMRP